MECLLREDSIDFLLMFDLTLVPANLTRFLSPFESDELLLNSLSMLWGIEWIILISLFLSIDLLFTVVLVLVYSPLILSSIWFSNLSSEVGCPYWLNYQSYICRSLYFFWFVSAVHINFTWDLVLFSYLKQSWPSTHIFWTSICSKCVFMRNKKRFVW